jgi:hypothetical protein
MDTTPLETPVTTPEPLTVATDGLLLAHVPPPVGLVRLIVLPWQTVEGPKIDPTDGVGLTVTTAFPDTVPGHPLASLTAVKA